MTRSRVVLLSSSSAPGFMSPKLQVCVRRGINGDTLTHTHVQLGSVFCAALRTRVCVGVTVQLRPWTAEPAMVLFYFLFSDLNQVVQLHQNLCLHGFFSAISQIKEPSCKATDRAICQRGSSILAKGQAALTETHVNAGTVTPGR